VVIAARGVSAVIDDIRAQVHELRQRSVTIEQEVKVLKDSGPEGEVIILRTIRRKQAKREIQELFQSGETLFYSDIARLLKLELALVVDLCQELEQEGEIEVCADAV
jgi:hypothetical protein